MSIKESNLRESKKKKLHTIFPQCKMQNTKKKIQKKPTKNTYLYINKIIDGLTM